MIRAILVTVVLLAFSVIAVAATVTLEWDYTEDALLLPVGGFRIYQKKQSDTVYPAAPAATIVPNTHIATITVNPGKYCWVATAYKDDIESPYSNEVCGQVTPNKPLNLRVK